MSGAQVEALLNLLRERIELLEATEAAYTLFGDFKSNWPGRITPTGQGLLIQMRGAIAQTTGRKEKEVQEGLKAE